MWSISEVRWLRAGKKKYLEKHKIIYYGECRGGYKSGIESLQITRLQKQLTDFVQVEIYYQQWNSMDNLR